MYDSLWFETITLYSWQVIWWSHRLVWTPTSRAESIWIHLKQASWLFYAVVILYFITDSPYPRNWMMKMWGLPFFSFTYSCWHHWVKFMKIAEITQRKGFILSVNTKMLSPQDIYCILIACMHIAMNKVFLKSMSSESLFNPPIFILFSDSLTFFTKEFEKLIYYLLIQF